MIILVIILCFAPAIAVFIYASYQDDKGKFKKGALWITGIGAILLLLLGISNYTKNSPFNNEQFGKNYNSIRLQSGIDTIPANWMLKNPRINNWFDRFKQLDEDYTLRYLNPDSAKNPVHLEKVIWVEGNQIRSELDYYRNNEQAIEIFYDYAQKNTRIDYFPHNGKNKEYNSSETDSILSSWKKLQ